MTIDEDYPPRALLVDNVNRISVMLVCAHYNEDLSTSHELFHTGSHSVAAQGLSMESGIRGLLTKVPLKFLEDLRGH
jgi:hypothetical protein